MRTWEVQDEFGNVLARRRSWRAAHEWIEAEAERRWESFTPVERQMYRNSWWPRRVICAECGTASCEHAPED